jgi:hypothetical protein
MHSTDAIREVLLNRPDSTPNRTRLNQLLCEIILFREPSAIVLHSIHVREGLTIWNKGQRSYRRTALAMSAQKNDPVCFCFADKTASFRSIGHGPLRW